MPTNEQLTRLAIFLATGYICAGFTVSVFAGLPMWHEFFENSFAYAAFAVIGILVLGILLGLAIIRYAVPRVGVKALFEQDVLVIMIGCLFIALAMNEAMLAVGLFVAGAGLAMYFFENFSVQVTAARKGGSSAFTLASWAIGPIVAIAALLAFADYGLITLRILFAHYIIICFWVWVQRLGLHFDYHDAPKIVVALAKDWVEPHPRKSSSAAPAAPVKTPEQEAAEEQASEAAKKSNTDDLVLKADDFSKKP